MHVVGSYILSRRAMAHGDSSSPPSPTPSVASALDMYGPIDIAVRVHLIRVVVLLIYLFYSARLSDTLFDTVPFPIGGQAGGRYDASTPRVLPRSSWWVFVLRSRTVRPIVCPSFQVHACRGCGGVPGRRVGVV